MIDLSHNKIPENVETIHLTAVCGTGMGALACMLKDSGYDVSGSDHAVYPPMSDFLREKGIKIMEGYSGENLSHDPDLIIIGNAISKDNPEVQKLIEKKINFCSMPQALNGLIAKGKKPIVITGTHGKTTTSSLMAWILYSANLDPTYMIGGIVKNFNSNYRLGKGDHIVIEGDEYDTAFFDKESKFFHYKPYIGVLGNIEFDHADIFKDLDHVKNTFRKFAEQVPQASSLLAFDNDKNVDFAIKNSNCKTIRYGKNDNSQWQLGKVEIKAPWNCFTVLKNNKIYDNFKTKLIGEHNLLNALSVIIAADKIGISKKVISKSLETFENVKRRQEVRGVINGITVMDDFAHHPTAVRETIKAVKPFYPKGKIIAVFEPRTNSSMRKIFQEIYPSSFDKADLI